MKKISLIFIFLLSFIGFDSVFAVIWDSVQYIDHLSPNYIWQKPINNSLDWSSLTNFWVDRIKSSPDWNYIYFMSTTVSNVWGIYKKSSFNWDVWEYLGIKTSWGFDISRDWNYILYSNFNDSWKLYIRLITSTWYWTKVLDKALSNSFPVYAKEENYFIYSNPNDGDKCYKKNALDTSTGIAITSQSCKMPIISSDWNYIYYHTGNDFQWTIWRKNYSDVDNWNSLWITVIFPITLTLDNLFFVYSNPNDWYKLYKKNASDTSTGVAITSRWWNFPILNWALYPTCYDWIKNQDETAIDFWGICGTWSVSYDSFWCINQSFVNPSDITWYSWLYTGTASLISPPIFTGSISAYYWTWTNYDIVTIYDYPFQTSIIDDRSFNYGAGYETYFEGWNIRTYSVRGWASQLFNAVAIYWTWTAWYGVFRHNWSQSFTTSVSPWTWSGVSYWIDPIAKSDVFDWIYAGTITGMRLWNTNSFTTKRSCKNESYSCEWKQNWATSFSCIYPYPYDLTDAENEAKCGIDNNWACVPIANVWLALPWQTTITTASGEVISSTWDPPTSSKISAIFSCDKNRDLETSWQEYLTCLTTVIDNAIEYWDKTQQEAQKITQWVVLTKTWTSNLFDQWQTTNNNMLSAIKVKGDTQLVGNTKTAIFVKIFYWLAILISIVIGLLLFKREK